jgi:hypothetical protein
MNSTTLVCRIDKRRLSLFEQRDRFNGIDYVEVLEGQKTLCVHFFGDVPVLKDAQHPNGLTIENIKISGGRRIQDVHAIAIERDDADDPEHDNCLRITLNQPGDFSIYRLCFQEKTPEAPDAWRAYGNFDSRYACVDFSFKVDCPSDLDCKVDNACPPKTLPAPDINYLAKDYATFRQLMFDRLAVTMPDWHERHVPDLGVALIELLAYAGDHLSYYQDAVATEAYLGTARQRISVRRHARLVDYTLHEGLNSRAWITVWTSDDTPAVKFSDLYFITGFPGIKATNGNVVSERDLQGIEANSYEVFEVITNTPNDEVRFFSAHREIRFYTWGDSECCLPKGATRATLLDGIGNSQNPDGALGSRALHLRIGDVLIFEEVIGPKTGNVADADPSHRHAVRLIKVTETFDPLLGGVRLLEIEWASDDALPFALCLSSRLSAPDCGRIENITVARGNVLLVDHGKTTVEDLGEVPTGELVGECACDDSIVEMTRVAHRFAPKLKETPLTFAEQVMADAVNTSASSLFKRTAHLAEPQVSLTSSPSPDIADSGSGAWIARTHLLASGRADQHFVVEMDDTGYAHLRFGDGELGMRPAAGSRFNAKYRIGNGPSGNVGRDTITHLVLRTSKWSELTVLPRNPIAASGGMAAEVVAEAKLFAPHAFRARRLRAITAEDYAELAGQQELLQRAAARLRWMGSWYEARVVLDPLNSESADEGLLQRVTQYLEPYRRMGHDLDVVRARYVPLDIAMQICVLPHHTRGEIKAIVLDVLSNREISDGRLGFFHPNRLSFGGSILLSQLIAAVQAIEGVESVTVTRLQRLSHRANGELQAGVLPISELEIAQLDNDPNFPENGKLTLTMGGGR